MQTNLQKPQSFTIPMIMGHKYGEHIFAAIANYEASLAPQMERQQVLAAATPVQKKCAATDDDDFEDQTPAKRKRGQHKDDNDECSVIGETPAPVKQTPVKADKAPAPAKATKQRQPTKKEKEAQARKEAKEAKEVQAKQAEKMAVAASKDEAKAAASPLRVSTRKVSAARGMPPLFTNFEFSQSHDS